jgi:phytoene dehydrogenase-like protein
VSDTYDVIAIGSGHNGLVAAAYMAVAGKKVLVLERNSWFGGGVVTRELTVPGFLHDQHSMAHIFIQANPLIQNDELGLLSKYGLRYIYPETPMISVFPDGETLRLYCNREKNYQEIARFSKKDAESYLRFAELGASFLPALTATLYSPPAPVGAMYAMMDQSREGRELMAIMLKSAYDIVMEWFESDRVRLHFMRVVSENLIGPEEKGTGVGLFMFASFLEKYGIGVPVGGSGSLTRALVSCIEAHGGTVTANTTVEKVLVKGGRAVGVKTADGRTYNAKDGVIGAIHPHLLSRFVDGLDPKVVQSAEKVQLTSNCVLTIHAALNEPLKFKAGDHVGKAMMIELLPPSLDHLRQHFDDLRYGRIPQQPLIGLGTPSNIDPSRVPPGKATMHAWDYCPYELPDGGAARWDTYKTTFVERMLRHMSLYIDNLTPENIIAYHSDSPLDMERTSPSFQRGDIHGVAPYLHQFGAHRPTPDLGQNTVPGVDRLYLVGPFQHPGGGVFGAGRATAMRMCDDLKMDFEKIVARAR